MRRPARILMTAFAAVTLVATAAVSTATAAPRGAGVADDEVLVAIQRDLGLSSAQVDELPTRQAAAVRLDVRLRSALGGVFGGSWFDAAAGALVVGVTDRARVGEVRAAGARAVVVEHGAADLDAILDELNALSGKTAGDDRAANGKSSLTGLAGWRVDPTRNRVVVTTLTGQRRPGALDALARHGDAVTYEETDHPPRTAAGFLDGGDGINLDSCSAGFNLRNPATGQGYLLTAGHCTADGQANTGNDGTFFGNTVDSHFPGQDDALISRDNAYWYQGPWVDQNPSWGVPVTVGGHSDVLVGSVVCKSGITTKWTCGAVAAKDEAVVYDGDPAMTVYGLTRHSACVEPGDSGGANVTRMSGVVPWVAEGVTSGAQLYWDGGRYRCGQVFGDSNVSWYFPIADSLSFYGPWYGVTTW
ncbi:S1 family peptidase [Actinophytocola sediminis]